jgi:hypothetical protein
MINVRFFKRTSGIHFFIKWLRNFQPKMTGPFYARHCIDGGLRSLPAAGRDFARQKFKVLKITRGNGLSEAKIFLIC